MKAGRMLGYSNWGKFYGSQEANFYKIACTGLLKILKIIIFAFKKNFKDVISIIEKKIKDLLSYLKITKDLVSIKKISRRLKRSRVD